MYFKHISYISVSTILPSHFIFGKNGMFLQNLQWLIMATTIHRNVLNELVCQTLCYFINRFLHYSLNHCVIIPGTVVFFVCF